MASAASTLGISSSVTPGGIENPPAPLPAQAQNGRDPVSLLTEYCNNKDWSAHFSMLKIITLASTVAGLAIAFFTNPLYGICAGLLTFCSSYVIGDLNRDKSYKVISEALTTTPDFKNFAQRVNLLSPDGIKEAHRLFLAHINSLVAANVPPPRPVGPAR
jgi:hypothetical protein